MPKPNEFPKTDSNASVAVINTNIAYIQRDINDIKQVLKDGYATKDSLAEVAKDTEKRLVRLENQSSLWKWLSPTFAAILGSILTFLIISFLQNTK